MLKIISRIEEISEFIEVDGYIPISIRWGDEISQPLYIRLGDFKHSLLEIGIEPFQHRIYSLVLVCSNKISIKEELNDIFINESSNYLPIFKINENNFKNNISDSLLDFNVIFTKNSLNIKINNNNINELIRTKNTIWGIDKNYNICFVKIINLTEKNINNMKKALNIDK